MVGDVHRTLLYGGIFGYPGDINNPNGEGRAEFGCWAGCWAGFGLVSLLLPSPCLPVHESITMLRPSWKQFVCAAMLYSNDFLLTWAQTVGGPPLELSLSRAPSTSLSTSWCAWHDAFVVLYGARRWRRANQKKAFVFTQVFPPLPLCFVCGGCPVSLHDRFCRSRDNSVSPPRASSCARLP